MDFIRLLVFTHFCQTLKSAHELEEEDRLAQSAVSSRLNCIFYTLLTDVIILQKLQELIRRGRPQDLVEANRLMKIMSGFVSKLDDFENG